MPVFSDLVGVKCVARCTSRCQNTALFLLKPDTLQGSFMVRDLKWFGKVFLTYVCKDVTGSIMTLYRRLWGLCDHGNYPFSAPQLWGIKRGAAAQSRAHDGRNEETSDPNNHVLEHFYQWSSDNWTVLDLCWSLNTTPPILHRRTTYMLTAVRACLLSAAYRLQQAKSFS